MNFQDLTPCNIEGMSPPPQGRIWGVLADLSAVVRRLVCEARSLLMCADRHTSEDRSFARTLRRAAGPPPGLVLPFSLAGPGVLNPWRGAGQSPARLPLVLLLIA